MNARAPRHPDPWSVSVGMLVALAGAALVVLVLSWRGTADIASVPRQVPYVVSGGFGGLALLGFAVGLLEVQHERRLEAQRRARVDGALRAVDALASVRSRETTESTEGP